jgi:acetolactate synthase-1/2/3 large subunit
LEECQLFRNENQPENEAYSQKKNSVNAYDIIFTVNQCFTDDEIFATDAGTAFYVTGQALKTNKKQQFLTSASLGSMGFALPAATGAAIANSERKVICITGDGSLMTNLSELAVAKRYCQNIIYIIISNNGYVSMRNTQDAFFQGRRIGEGPNSGVEIPSIQKTAELFEINFNKVHSKDQLKTILLKLKKKPGPHLVEVVSNEEQEIIPTVKSKKLDNGKMISGTLHPMFPYK